MNETFTALDMLNTVVAGLAIVFGVLLLIYFAICLMKLFFYTIPNMRNTQAKEQVKESHSSIDHNHEHLDDSEEAAVVAVIVASMGKNTNPYRINSIIRR